MSELVIVVLNTGQPDTLQPTVDAINQHIDESYTLFIEPGPHAIWDECLGHDTILIEAGHLPQTPRWTAILRAQSQVHGYLLSLLPPYLGHVWAQASSQECAGTDNLLALSTAVLFVPAAVTEKLGGWQDYGHPRLDGADYISRARLLGHAWVYSLRVRQTVLVPEAGVSPDMQHTEAYQRLIANTQAYGSGEKDIYVEADKALRVGGAQHG